jgi:hypothetical protein
MARGEFEKELDEYIAQRRKAGFKFPNVLKAFARRKKQVNEPKLPPEVQKYDETTPAEPYDSLPGEKPEPKPGLFTRLLKGLGVLQTEEKTEDIPAGEVKQMLAKDDVLQDTKEIAKIALAAVKQLPEEQLSAFKSGPEFARLKELLKKHQLIK